MVYFLIFIFLSMLYLLLPSQRISFKFIKLKKYIFPICIVIFLMLTIIYSNSSFQSAHQGFMLWANNVLPSLLPFFICIELIKQTNFMEAVGRVLEPIMRPIFNVPGCGAFAIIMGISSGYPVGAKIVSNLRKENACTKLEAERLLAFTNTSGPLFIVGSIGVAMFDDSKIGILLLLTHFISSLIVGILFRFYHRTNEDIITQSLHKSNRKEPFNINKLGLYMGNAIKTSIDTLLLICGYVVFFSVLVNVFDSTGISSIFGEFINKILKLLHYSNKTSNAIFTGIMEVTGGISNISKITSLQTSEILTIVSFLLGFGGLSVCMQVNSIISDTDISLKPYIIGKLLQAIIASILTNFIMKNTSFFNWDVIETFSYSTANTPQIISSGNSVITCIGSIFLFCVVVNACNRFFSTYFSSRASVRMLLHRR